MNKLVAATTDLENQYFSRLVTADAARRPQFSRRRRPRRARWATRPPPGAGSAAQSGRAAAAGPGPLTQAPGPGRVDAARNSLGFWPGPEAAVELYVLRFFCGLSEAAEDSRCNGCPIKSVSERRSERIECKADLQSPASDRAPKADTPARSDHAPRADTPARASVSTNVMVRRTPL